MIPDVGAQALLDAQDTYLAGCYWGLFTNNATISSSSVWADLTEAAWTGYARVAVGTVPASSIISGRAQTSPSAFPTFTNGSGGAVTYYGWFLLDTLGNKLVAADNIGLNTIPDTGVVGLAPAFSDRQE